MVSPRTYPVLQDNLMSKFIMDDSPRSPRQQYITHSIIHAVDFKTTITVPMKTSREVLIQSTVLFQNDPRSRIP